MWLPIWLPKLSYFCEDYFQLSKTKSFNKRLMASVIPKFNEFYVSKGVCVLFRISLRGLYALRNYILC
jgi:hypothetical protein